MKKTIAAIAVCAAAIILPTAVNAAENDTDVIFYSEPEFTVMIPCDTTVFFSDAMTDLGFVGLSDARLGADMSVEISLLYSGRMKNRSDSSKTIAYRIVAENEKKYCSGSYHRSGEKTRLYVSIEGDEWERAFSGEYIDTICFDISYKKTSCSAEVKT